MLTKHVPKVLAPPQMQDVWREPLENIAPYAEAVDAGLTPEALKLIGVDSAKL